MDIDKLSELEPNTRLPYTGLGGVLNKVGINEGLSDESIIIDPFRPENLGPNSYDVTLGKWYWTRKITNNIGLEANSAENSVKSPLILDPCDVAQLSHTWFLKKAVSAREFQDDFAPFLSEQSLNYHLINNSQVIVLNAGDFILCHSEEFIGGRRDKFGQLASRSSWRRNGGDVCSDAGVGDVGFIDRWTWEMSNSTSKPILLCVGHRYAQILFIQTTPNNTNIVHNNNSTTRTTTTTTTTTGTTVVSYADYSSKSGSKYQYTSNLAHLKLFWNPYKMLSKKHLDREVTNILKVPVNIQKYLKPSKEYNELVYSTLIRLLNDGKYFEDIGYNTSFFVDMINKVKESLSQNMEVNSSNSELNIFRDLVKAKLGVVLVDIEDFALCLESWLHLEEKLVTLLRKNRRRKNINSWIKESLSTVDVQTLGVFSYPVYFRHKYWIVAHPNIDKNPPFSEDHEQYGCGLRDQLVPSIYSDPYFIIRLYCDYIQLMKNKSEVIHTMVNEAPTNLLSETHPNLEILSALSETQIEDGYSSYFIHTPSGSVIQALLHSSNNTEIIKKSVVVYQTFAALRCLLHKDRLEPESAPFV